MLQRLLDGLFPGLRQRRPPARWVAAWGLAGVALAFAEGAARLGARALETVAGGLTAAQWVALVVTVALFIYGEGVRALARRFVPHVVRRALVAADHPSASAFLLAPLFSMSLICDAPRAMARAWLGVVLIVVAVLLVRLLPDPWRGVVDAGVACALALGLAALVVQGARAIAARSAS